jgi:hydrogenase maturation protease
MKVLIYGIGNPGRQDDGLGALFVENVQRALESNPGSGGAVRAGEGRRYEFSFDANYQLNIEDAELISHFDVAVFVDASLGGGDPASGRPQSEEAHANRPFRFFALRPEPAASFSTHSVSPGGIVALCGALYDAAPSAYMLAIRGYEWSVNEELSPRARENLNAATEFLLEALRSAPEHGCTGHSLLDSFLS